MSAISTDQFIEKTNKIKIRVALDSQKLSSIQACPRHYFYSFIVNLEPIVKEEALERGDLVHEMLKVYYRLRQHRNRWTKNNKTHGDVQKSCIIVGRHHARKMNLDVQEVEEAIKAFQEYTDFVEHDGWDDEKILDVERVGSIKLYEDESLVILWEFKIDLMLKLGNMPVIAVDHKTAKRKVTPSMLSNQFFGYCFALDNNNIIINSIGMQKTLPSKEKFVRHTISYPQELIENWKKNSIWWVRQALKYHEEDFYPQNFTSCDKYSGCKFRDLCETEEAMRHLKVEALYHIRDEHWDVGTLLKG